MHVNHDQLKKILKKNRWLKICFRMTVWKNNDWSREINHFFSTWPEYLRVLVLICSHEIIFCEIYWGGDERKISIHSSISNHDFFTLFIPSNVCFSENITSFSHPTPHKAMSMAGWWMWALLYILVIKHFFGGWKARFRSKKGKKLSLKVRLLLVPLE